MSKHQKKLISEVAINASGQLIGSLIYTGVVLVIAVILSHAH